MQYGHFDNEKRKKIRSLKWKFAKIMLLCWVLPFLVIIGLVGSYMLITQRENQMERLEAQAGLNTRTCAERLNGAISDSRQATYDGTLFEQYRQYRRQGSTGERIFSNGVQNYLNVQYSHRKNNIFTVLMLKEDPLNKHYTSYNFGTGGNYAMIQNFFDKDRRIVEKQFTVFAVWNIFRGILSERRVFDLDAFFGYNKKTAYLCGKV